MIFSLWFGYVAFPLEKSRYVKIDIYGWINEAI
jgi:hypothetical protein